MVLTTAALSYEDTQLNAVLHHSSEAFVGQMETVPRSPVLHLRAVTSSTSTSLQGMGNICWRGLDGL